MLERYLIEHCSPTLANIKAANLFSCPTACVQQLEQWNQMLQGKGIRVELLRLRQNTALVYVYRPSRLARDLAAAGVADFLRQQGYTQLEPENILHQLRSRLASCAQFPHEIGVFLGYPLGDVLGFIQYAGTNYKCSGCWKVYCDACQAKRLFTQFHKCRRVYQQLFVQGRSIQKLTVAA